jgi:hypothetical protein
MRRNFLQGKFSETRQLRQRSERDPSVRLIKMEARQLIEKPVGDGARPHIGAINRSINDSVGNELKYFNLQPSTPITQQPTSEAIDRN